VLSGGRRHGHFPQMWQFKKILGRGKFVAVSDRKVLYSKAKFLKRTKVYTYTGIETIFFN
jgi:hypothetical protein